MHWLIVLTCLTAFDPPAKAKSRHAIVVAAPMYREALEPWADHRRAHGFEITWIDPVPLMGATSGEEAVELLRQEIEQATHRRDTASDLPGDSHAAFVLLVGDAPAAGEPFDPARLVPATIRTERMRPSNPRRFASDQVYALPDENGVGRLAVGRWPARTAAEVAMQVEKTLRYETKQQPGLHRAQITFLATTPNYDPVLDPALERLAIGTINSTVGPHWTLRALYSSPRSDFFPGPTETSRQVTRWLEDATPMTLFAGHGYDCGVDYVRYEGRLYAVLDSDLAKHVDGDRPGTVLWVSACSCGTFDLPAPRRGLAESLMMNPRGPIAVVAGSHETSAYANLLLCLGLGRDVIEQPPSTLGEAVLRFKRAAFRPGPPLLKSLLLSLEPMERPEFMAADHQFLYNLLGDPTLRLSLPSKTRIDAQVQKETDGSMMQVRVNGTIEGWTSGTAWLSLTLDRLASKRTTRDPAALSDLADRKAAYLERFQNANDKIAKQVQTRIDEGRFSVVLELPTDLASRVRWLQAYVHREDGSGQWTDAVAAQPLRLVEETPPR